MQVFWLQSLRTSSYTIIMIQTPPKKDYTTGNSKNCPCVYRSTYPRPVLHPSSAYLPVYHSAWPSTSLRCGNWKGYANMKTSYLLLVANASSQAGPLGSLRRTPVSAKQFPPRLMAGHRSAFGVRDTEVCKLMCELLPPGAIPNVQRASSLWTDKEPGRGRSRMASTLLTISKRVSNDCGPSACPSCSLTCRRSMAFFLSVSFPPTPGASWGCFPKPSLATNPATLGSDATHPYANFPSSLDKKTSHWPQAAIPEWVLWNVPRWELLSHLFQQDQLCLFRD